MQEVLELMGTLADFVGRLEGLRNGQPLGVLEQVADMRTQLVAAHTERCEALLAAIKQELRQLVGCSQAIDVLLDAAHEHYHRVLGASAPRSAGGAGGADVDQAAAATEAACLRTETEPSAVDYMQWLLETQRAYQRECGIAEQLVERLDSYDDGALVQSVRQGWQAQPHIRALAVGLDSGGAVTAGARVVFALEAEAKAAAEAAAKPLLH